MVAGRSLCYILTMDKKIKELKNDTEAELKRIDKMPDGEVKRAALAELARYHDNMTRNLQHERLIHLMVTILFAALMIGSWLGLLSWFNADDGQYDLVTWLMITAVALLTIIEAAYVRYYYLLENGIVTLYPQQRTLHQKTASMLK